MSSTHISILLETVSFFFVTTDLYGEKRLTVLKDKLILLKSVGDDQKSNDAVSWFAFAITIAGAVFLLYKLWIVNFSSFGIWYSILIVIGVIILGLALFSVAGIYVVFVFYAVFSLVLDFLIFFIKRALKFVTLQGFLLIIGMLLFLISKYIAWTVD